MRTVKHQFKVGDDVSYGFNGDAYYGGKVARITKKYLTTDRGQKYYLKLYDSREYNDVTGKYENVMREYFVSVGHHTWTLLKGIIERQNPHF